MKQKYILSAIGIMILAIVSSFGVAKINANPSYFALSSSTSTATTTPAYMTPGTATSTLSFDSQVGIAQSVDSAILAIQFTGSSTESTLFTQLEYSQNGIDWFLDRQYANGTSSQVFNLNQQNIYSFKVGTTTTGGLPGAPSIATTTTAVINVRTPMRYVRAVFTLPQVTERFNGAVWAQFIGKREAN
jgi:hypothetical protein